MCIFAQPVLSVTNTNIFARLQPDDWQHLVYQMDFRSIQKNAIILPLPVKQGATEAETMKFVSLKEYDSFFDDLAKGFPLAPSRPLSFGSIDSRVDSLSLDVHEVGDFIASFVPTIGDFDRLDKQFRVSRESWDKIPVYSDYGFAVFQLQTLEGKPHPMAFKFNSRLGDQGKGSIFFPTVHIHDGEVHSKEKFDHALYLQSPAFDSACGNYQQKTKLVTDRATGYVRSKWAAEHFCDIQNSKGILTGDGLVHRLKMKGMRKNTDVVAKQNLSHASMPFEPPLFQSLTAASLFASAAGVKWFCNRRNEVSASEGH